jgi:hypothetical protein
MVAAGSKRGAGQSLKFGVRQGGYLPNRMPAIHRRPEQQEPPDFPVAVQPSAPGPVRLHGTVAALPGAQRIDRDSGQLCNGSDGIEGWHVFGLTLLSFAKQPQLVKYLY